jgi:hypothetical protein
MYVTFLYMNRKASTLCAISLMRWFGGLRLTVIHQMPNGSYKVQIQNGIKQILADHLRVINLEAV